MRSLSERDPGSGEAPRRPIDDTNLPYWELCAALRLARLVGAGLEAWAAFFIPWGRPDLTPQTIRRRYQYFVARALKLESFPLFTDRPGGGRIAPSSDPPFT